MKREFVKIFLSVFILIFTINSAYATVIVGPTSGTTNITVDLPLVHTYDQSGLSASYVSGVTDFDSFVATTTHNSNPGSDFVTSSAIGYIDYNLGGIFNIDRIAFWNFGVNLSYAVTAFDLTGNSTLLGTFNPSVQSNPNPAQVFSFGPITTQFFRLDNFVNNGASGLAIGEVAFGTSVPEPTTLALIGLGLAGIGWKRRKA